MKFDYTTVIGRDPKLFAWHVSNVLENAGISRDHWAFNVYVYYNEQIPNEITDEILAICQNNNIAYELHYESPHEPFLNRLYKAWNRVQLMGRAPLTIRGGSDQSFWRGSFATALDLWESLGEECIINFQTVESLLATQSRHFTVDCGTTAASYSHEAFEDFCKKIRVPGAFKIDEAMRIWEGRPGAFHSSLTNPHYRGDGCSWLQSKELFRKIGPMPAMGRGITGDVWLHDMYEMKGIPSYIAGDAITYHLVKGESR